MLIDNGETKQKGQRKHVRPFVLPLCSFEEGFEKVDRGGKNQEKVSSRHTEDAGFGFCSGISVCPAPSVESLTPSGKVLRIRRLQVQVSEFLGLTMWSLQEWRLDMRTAVAFVVAFGRRFGKVDDLEILEHDIRGHLIYQ